MNQAAALAGTGALAALFGAALLVSVGNPGGALFVFLLGLFCLAGTVKALAGATDDAPDPGTDGPGDDGDDPADPALAELRRRYARGELTDAEYERKLETLLETGSREAVREFLDDGSRA